MTLYNRDSNNKKENAYPIIKYPIIRMKMQNIKETYDQAVHGGYDNKHLPLTALNIAGCTRNVKHYHAGLWSLRGSLRTDDAICPC
jgi:hypothetical protein